LKFLSKFEGVAYAAMRIIVGFFFACHGAQKILGMFGGVEGKAVPFELSWIFIGGLVELVAGTLIAVGLLTRVAAFMASGQMAVAYFKFHAIALPPGFSGNTFMHDFFTIINQEELAAPYCFVFLYIATHGTGKLGIQKD